MTGPSHITNPPVALGGDRAGGHHAAPEVKVRAAVGRNSDSPEERKALSRLARVLAAGEPPATDVPRGFYLNIRV